MEYKENALKVDDPTAAHKDSFSGGRDANNVVESLRGISYCSDEKHADLPRPDLFRLARGSN